MLPHGWTFPDAGGHVHEVTPGYILKIIRFSLGNL